MPERINKIKYDIIRAIILIVLFLAAFALGFYIINIFEINPAPRVNVQTNIVQNVFQNEELKKRIASNEIGFAGFDDWAKVNNLSGENVYDADSDKDGLANYLEFIHGTNPNILDTDHDGYSDRQEIINGYDPDDTGDTRLIVYVQIEKIGVSVPMVWSNSEVEKEMLRDLESGAAHYAKTAAPGQIGNMIISGHSSNYIWAKGDYNYIFKNLNNLEVGDKVVFRTVQKNGKVITYNYTITEKFVTSPDDEKIFAETKNPTLTLSTCWPLGTNFKRLIVKGELVK